MSYFRFTVEGTPHASGKLLSASVHWLNVSNSVLASQIDVHKINSVLYKKIPTRKTFGRRNKAPLDLSWYGGGILSP